MVLLEVLREIGFPRIVSLAVRGDNAHPDLWAHDFSRENPNLMHHRSPPTATPPRVLGR